MKKVVAALSLAAAMIGCSREPGVSTADLKQLFLAIMTACSLDVPVRIRRVNYVPKDEG